MTSKEEGMAHGVIVIAGKDPTTLHGGTQSYVRAYGRAALRAGYEPHLFCVSDRAEVLATDFGIIHRAWSPFRPFRTLMIAFHGPFVVNCVEAFVRQQKGPHLIHSFGCWSGVGDAAAQRLRKHGIEAMTLATPFGTYTHETRGKLRGLRPEHSPLMWLQHWCELFWTRLTVVPSERRGLAGARLVLVNYDSVEKIIRAEFGNSIRFHKMTYASEAALLKEGVASSRLPENIAALEPRHAPLVVSVSRHDLRKGISVLLRALAEIRARGIPFRACLVGGGQALYAHRRLTERLGLAGCTTVLGWVPDSYHYLEHADVFVLPSLEESSGSISLLEAMQAGVASVVSRVDGLPEDVADGDSALLVDPGDAGALATALARVLTDAELRACLSQNARKRYEERFSTEAFTVDLKRVYTELGFGSPAQNHSQQ